MQKCYIYMYIYTHTYIYTHITPVKFKYISHSEPCNHCELGLLIWFRLASVVSYASFVVMVVVVVQHARGNIAEK